MLQYFRFALVVFFASMNGSLAYAQVKLHVWHKNLERTETRAFLQLALDKAKADFGEYTLVAQSEPDVLAAIANMQEKRGIDLIVSGVNLTWEQQLLPVYVPLERGLLGFRVCLINRGAAETFAQVKTSEDFARLGVRVAVGSNWPDRTIMTNHQIAVSHAADYQDVLAMLSQKRVDCFSRSVIEASQEQDAHPEFGIEQRLGFVYPLADLIYVRPDAEPIRHMLDAGLKRAIEDGSYRRLFNTFYHNTLLDLDFYARKLLIMGNQNMSEQARQAINRYGVASFSKGIK